MARSGPSLLGVRHCRLHPKRVRFKNEKRTFFRVFFLFVAGADFATEHHMLHISCRGGGKGAKKVTEFVSLVHDPTDCLNVFGHLKTRKKEINLT